MHKRTISFVDSNTNTQTHTEFGFYLTVPEIADIGLQHEEGLLNEFNKLVTADDRREIVKFLDKLILAAVGTLDDEGYLVKSDKITGRFEYGGAYNQLFDEIGSDPEKMTKFITAIVPSQALGNVTGKKDGPKPTQEELLEAWRLREIEARKSAA